MIWDGECGLCSHTAQWVRKKDKTRSFQIVTYQNCPRPPMDDRRYERCKREVLVVDKEGREFFGPKGMLFILAELGWGGFARLLMLPPFIWVIAVGYFLVARNRGLISRTFFKGEACGLENRYPEVD